MMSMGRGLFIVLLALLAMPLLAGSLEFRSDGYFASPDARVKIVREAWRYAPHLDVDGKLAVNIDGPILRPGYITMNGEKTTTEIDAARRSIVDSGTLGTFAAPCRRTMREYRGGLLLRLEYGQTPPAVTDAFCRFIFPIDIFKNRRARWDEKTLTLPADKPANLTYWDDPAGGAHQFRIDLGNGQELGVKFLSPLKDLSFSDCRQWQEMNYHLQAQFAGNVMLAYLCLLKPDEPFPAVTPPTDPPAAPAVKVSDAGALFSAREGLYEIQVAKSGQVAVRKQGQACFDIETPYVKENETYSPLAEPVSFQATGNRVEVVTRAKVKPYRLRQVFTQEEDGWINVTATFEGVDARLQQGTRVEMALPAAAFAGKVVRAGERYIDLPATTSPDASLVNDWEGKVLEYDLPPAGQERMTVVCDRKGNSYLNDYRKWNQTSFKIALTPRDGTVQYRLHFWNAENEPVTTLKGNLLRNGASFETGGEGVRPFASYSWTEKMVEPGIPPVFDTTTAVHGTTSLRLTASDPVKLGNPRGFAFVGAVFNRVQLQRDHRYTVSAYLKADRPGMKAVLYCGETTWAGQEWGEIPVTTEWKRYSIPFNTDDFKKSGYYLTWVGMAPGCKEGTLWVDAVQLEAGDLSDFQPAQTIECAVEADSKEKLFESGKPCTLLLHVRNNGKNPIAGAVKYVIRDYWEHEVRAGAVQINEKAETTAVHPVDLGKLPCGYYRGKFTAPDGGVHEVIFGVYQPQPLTPLPDDWPLACHNDPSPLVRKLGFGAVRAFDVFTFSGIAPEKGKFDFTRADRMVKAAKDCGLAIMPILGEFQWPAYRPDPPIPPYAQEKVTLTVIGGRQIRLTWPTQEAWKGYVRALTARYKGEITHWEVMNEPNLLMSAGEYVPYLQSAYAAAKEGNPDCRVVGVCATSDFAGKPGSFTDSVFKQGGAKCFDILSVHLYHPNPPERTLEIGSDKLLEQWRKSLKETYGADLPVWHTERSFISRELGYSRDRVNVPLDYCDEPQFFIDTFQQKAEYLLRETLLDAVAGKDGRFFWFGLFNDESSFINIRYAHPYGLGHSEFDSSPTPELLAANGLARVLTGMSHPCRQVAWDDANRCVVFTGEKGSVAALWNWKGSGHVVISGLNNRCMLDNFFGEPTPVATDAIGVWDVPLDGAPKYLVFQGMDGEACCRLLEKAKGIDISRGAAPVVPGSK